MTVSYAGESNRSLQGSLDRDYSLPPFSIIVEYCTRSTFHTKHRPEKYAEYFLATKRAFQSRYPSIDVVGNPEEHFKGRRSFRIDDHLRPLEDVSRPRLGAFEVTLLCDRTGARTVFSKLESRRWPNARSLVNQAERVSAGEDALPRMGSPQDVQDKPLPLGLKVKRNLRIQQPRTERCWEPPRAEPPERVRDLRELSAKLCRRGGPSLRGAQRPKTSDSSSCAEDANIFPPTIFEGVPATPTCEDMGSGYYFFEEQEAGADTSEAVRQSALAAQAVEVTDEWDTGFEEDPPPQQPAWAATEEASGPRQPQPPTGSRPSSRGSRPGSGARRLFADAEAPAAGYTPAAQPLTSQQLRGRTWSSQEFEFEEDEQLVLQGAQAAVAPDCYSEFEDSKMSGQYEDEEEFPLPALSSTSPGPPIDGPAEEKTRSPVEGQGPVEANALETQALPAKLSVDTPPSTKTFESSEFEASGPRDQAQEPVIHAPPRIVKKEVEFEISRSAGQKFGMVVQPDDEGRSAVISIRAGGRVDEWGSQNPNMRISVGDVLMSVNGETDYDQIMIEFKSSAAVTIRMVKQVQEVQETSEPSAATFENSFEEDAPTLPNAPPAVAPLVAASANAEGQPLPPNEMTPLPPDASRPPVPAAEEAELRKAPLPTASANLSSLLGTNGDDGGPACMSSQQLLATTAAQPPRPFNTGEGQPASTDLSGSTSLTDTILGSARSAGLALALDGGYSSADEAGGAAEFLAQEAAELRRKVEASNRAEEPSHGLGNPHLDYDDEFEESPDGKPNLQYDAEFSFPDSSGAEDPHYGEEFDSDFSEDGEKGGAQKAYQHDRAEEFDDDSSDSEGYDQDFDDDDAPKKAFKAPLGNDGGAIDLGDSDEDLFPPAPPGAVSDDDPFPPGPAGASSDEDPFPAGPVGASSDEDSFPASPAGAASDDDPFPPAPAGTQNYDYDEDFADDASDGPGRWPETQRELGYPSNTESENPNAFGEDGSSEAEMEGGRSDAESLEDINGDTGAQLYNDLGDSSDEADPLSGAAGGGNYEYDDESLD